MIKLDSIITRKNKFFFKYCLIGASSILIELIIRNYFLYLNFNKIFILILPLLIGITFAFICNIKFNFNVPRYYYTKSFIYFTLISLSSFSLQHFLSNLFTIQSLNYEFTRFLMSGLVFIVAYNFHIKFSFRRNKKVGVAIYLDENENIDEIFSKVGFYPDYIHVDMVDKSMNENVKEPDFRKLHDIKKKWPNHRIESHIMSTKPLQYIEKFSKYSDVIYFHNEIDENKNLIKNEIIKNGKKPGIVIHASKENKNIKEMIESFNEVLLLCIENPGKSGQKFIDNTYSILEKLNKLNNRSKFLLCVDGGLSQDNIKILDCDKIVSASNVFQNINPKRQIENLQKILNK